ncbi:hypothetical protein DL95DRAFT_397671, partial [Leptodontidium sp. 2 PMI_412]
MIILSDSRDGDPAFSSDNGDSSEAECRSSTSKQSRWSIKKEGRSWSWTFRKFPSRTELTSNTSPRPTMPILVAAAQRPARSFLHYCISGKTRELWMAGDTEALNHWTLV